MRPRPYVIVPSLLAIAAAAGSHAQEVKYEKYQLGNGMTVILHEDHSLPVSAINLWYRVGSKDEPPRRSGFAHLFEHLMFMGTQRVPGNAFDEIMEGGGGSNNASTAEDRTNYYSAGPAGLLPTLLWLDADRLEDLGCMMDQAKLDKQRDIVRNERRQSYENEPYGKAELKIQDLMFPPGHPYHIPVIGTHADLEAATVSDVKDFFATYYVPNNCALVVAGDFDPAQIKPLIAEQFGTLPRGGEAMHRSAPPVRLERVLRTTLLDAVQLPLIAFVYHSPAQFVDGDAELDLAADVLAEGKTSRLYKRLVYDDKLAVSVSADQQAMQLGSLFRIDVMAELGADFDKIEQAVDEELARLLETGPTAAELEQRQAKVELSMLSNMQSVEARADKLNEYEYFWGEPDSFKRDLDRFRNATPDGVRQWARQVLRPDGRLILRVLPESPERPSSPRDNPLDTGPAAVFRPPAPQAFKLANGMPVLLWQKTTLPLIALRMSFAPGGPLDTVTGENPIGGQAGLAALTAQMLEEGAGDRDALQFNDALQALGAQFDASSDHESATVALTVLKRNFPRAAALLADAVRRPRLDEKEWERVKRLHMEELKQQDDDPQTVAARVAARTLFGDKHPYGWPVDGLPETVEPLTLSDVQTRQRAIFQPGCATLLLAGDVTPDEAKATLDKVFSDWSAPLPLGEGAGGGSGSRTVPLAEGGKIAVLPDLPKSDVLRLIIVDRPEAVQTVVEFMLPGPRFADAHRVPYRVLNSLLGGSFTSRLNLNLREEHGYTYGAHSAYALAPSAGYFAASSAVKADVTGDAVHQCLAELERVRTGDVSDNEATKARQALMTQTIHTFSQLDGVLAAAEERTVAGLSFGTLAEDFAALQIITAGELNDLAQAALPLEGGVLVLVGDKAAIEAQLEDLADLPAPIELDARGKRVAGE
jgi:zinc protease